MNPELACIMVSKRLGKLPRLIEGTVWSCVSVPSQLVVRSCV